MTKEAELLIKVVERYLFHNNFKTLNPLSG